jgi:hypothetical protein
MPVKVLWLEANEVPPHFVHLGHTRVFRVMSYDGTSTDFSNGADAAKMAYQLQDEEDRALGLPGEHV